MSFSDLISVLSTQYSAQITQLLTSRDKIPRFILDLMEFIDISPLWGISLLENPLDILSDFKNCIISIERSFIQNSTVTTSFSLNIQSSPICVSRLSDIFLHPRKMVNVTSLAIKSLSSAKTIINSSEFFCRSCIDSFSVFADLAYVNTIEYPYSCKVKKIMPNDLKALPKTKVVENTMMIDQDSEKCLGSCFDILEGTNKYSDYQEAIISDGKQELSAIMEGALCHQVKPGDSVEVTCILTQRWLKEFISGQTCEAEYVLLIFDIRKVRPICQIPKSGIAFLKDSFLGTDEFSVRETILRSAFPQSYGNYYVKFGILLNCLAYFGKACSNVLIMGESGTGKSTFVSSLQRLLQGNIKILNGALTYKSCLNKSFLKNSLTGSLEAGLMQSESLLCIDDFHLLKDKPLVYKAMESRSVIAFVMTYENNENSNHKNQFDPTMNKGIKLTPEMDRFDLILKVANYTHDSEFCTRKLSDSSMEESSNIWDVDTIRAYLLSIVRPLEGIDIKNPKIQSLLERFIAYMITYNLKFSDGNSSSGLSIRLLESTIKLAKANAMLMSHKEVMMQDVLDIMLLISLGTQDDCGLLNQAFINRQMYHDEISRLLYNIELCVGPSNT
ncbi:MCM9_1 [Blepharisma stoltei]|uniref:AAA+ ATPase domain-containing protein n=1 Tax=Blepharisma stoltei TaxID=1481888 RepID=A0AAU9IUP4_9CILI|nr:unnamed protein product [Blepharisma stoltei]